MNEHEVYEKWKTQRGSIEPTSDFTDRVMSGIASDHASVNHPLTKSQPVAGRYAAAVTAVIAASISYYLVERPVREWGRRKTDSWLSSRATEPEKLSAAQVE